MHDQGAVADGEQSHTQHAAQPDGIRKPLIPPSAGDASGGSKDRDIDQVGGGKTAQRLIEHWQSEGQFELHRDDRPFADPDCIAASDLGAHRVAQGFEVPLYREIKVAFARLKYWRFGCHRAGGAIAAWRVMD